jgi:hypothetical protein
MEVLYPRCAGLDVHKDTVVASVRVIDGGEVQTFATTTPHYSPAQRRYLPRDHLGYSAPAWRPGNGAATYSLNFNTCVIDGGQRRPSVLAPRPLQLRFATCCATASSTATSSLPTSRLSPTDQSAQLVRLLDRLGFTGQIAPAVSGEAVSFLSPTGEPDPGDASPVPREGRQDNRLSLVYRTTPRRMASCIRL